VGTLKNQNSIQVEIKSRLKSGNACYHLMQNFCLKFILKYKNSYIQKYDFACYSVGV